MKTNLQAVRKRAGFKSARAFAESIGLNPYTYTSYEQGKSNFTLAQAWEFADALHCSLDELAGRQWPPPGEAARRADPYEEELVGCYRRCTPGRRAGLVQSARDAALASGEGAERGDAPAEGVSA